MNKNVKYALFFMGGVTIGLGVSGIKAINYALNDEYLRDAMARKISDKVDKALFGDSHNIRSRTGYVSYRRYDEERKRSQPKSIIFNNRNDAQRVLDNFELLIDDYGYATVGDLYELADLEADYNDHKYGWTSVSKFEICATKLDGTPAYEILTPRAVPV